VSTIVIEWCGDAPQSTTNLCRPLRDHAGVVRPGPSRAGQALHRQTVNPV